MLPRSHLRRRAFTLVEILSVIAIIGILASMTFGLFGFVQTSKREAKARGEIALLRTKLEEFKNRYGEYPMAKNTSAEEWQRALFDALTGVKGYVKTADTMGKTKLDWGTEIDVKKRKPFIATGEVGTDSSYAGTDVTPTYFTDPWGNPYQYRYGVLTAGKLASTWDNPSYLLISAGAKYTEPFVAAVECFEDTMETTGIVPKDYFEDTNGKRNDNLTNFGDK